MYVHSTSQVGDTRSIDLHHHDAMWEPGPRYSAETHKVRYQWLPPTLQPSMHLSSSIGGRYGFLDGFQYPTTGRDARASPPPSAYPAEPVHCRRGARASLRGVCPVVSPVDEAPARASARCPPVEVFVWEAPARVRAPDPPVVTAHTPLETPLESPAGPRRPREAAGRERPQRPPRGPGRKSESRLAILGPRPSPRRALLGSRALRGRGHICCKSHTNSRSRNHLGANEAGAAG